MNAESPRCPECGASWADGQTCSDHFHSLLYWELDGGLPDVHHLMVLSYFLQHPSLYSPEGLQQAIRLLQSFLEEGVSTEEMRRRIGPTVDSGTRTRPIAGREGARGAYVHPVTWSLRITDVVAAGPDDYYASVHAWAVSILAALRAAGVTDSGAA